MFFDHMRLKIQCSIENHELANKTLRLIAWMMCSIEVVFLGDVRQCICNGFWLVTYEAFVVLKADVDYR